jgi:hypothetical protein
MPKHVGVENLERINKKSTTSLSICWYFYKRYYKMLGSTIKIKRTGEQFHKCQLDLSNKLLTLGGAT